MIIIQGVTLFTMKEAAKYKGMKYEAFRYYCHNERGPQRHKQGYQWVCTKEALDAWEKQTKPRGGKRK